MGIIDIMAYKVESWSGYNIMIFTVYFLRWYPHTGFHLMVPLVRIGDQKRKLLGGSELVAVQQQPRGEVSFCDVDGFHMGV